MYLNKATILGNLTGDTELRAIPSGTQVATFSVATNRVWKDKDGSKKEDVQFHNVVVFGRAAETAAQYLKKGSQVLVEGRMQTRSWDDKNSGEKKYRTEIIADSSAINLQASRHLLLLMLQKQKAPQRVQRSRWTQLIIQKKVLIQKTSHSRSLEIKKY